jgi:hypothetical protein
MREVLVATPQAIELKPLLETLERCGHSTRIVKLGVIECFEVRA